MTGAPDAGAAAPPLTLTGTRLFTAWMAGHGGTLAFTTYQAGKLFLVGLNRAGGLSVFERTFDRCMGLGAAPPGPDGRTPGFWMSSLYQMWRFEDFMEVGAAGPDAPHDAHYVPLAGHTTGDVDVHDIHVGADGDPLFVATRFNCLARLTRRGSFAAVWRPPFVDRLAAEDRCHLNGLACEDDAPAYVTCVGRSNVAEGWRDHRRNGGLVLDVASGEAVCGGLSMPHSPRLHRGDLWMLQSGTGEFGRVDRAAGRFEPVCFLPGFARGLTFAGDYAIVGLSDAREGRTFAGLALDNRLAREGARPRCAICVVNLTTGDVEHRLDVEGVVRELYDVALLHGVQRPRMLGFRNDEIRLSIKPLGG